MTGAVRNAGGKVEEALGHVTGDSKSQVKGLVDQAQGTAENLHGQAKDAATDAARGLRTLPLLSHLHWVGSSAERIARYSRDLEMKGWPLAAPKTVRAATSVCNPSGGLPYSSRLWRRCRLAHAPSMAKRSPATKAVSLFST